MSRQQTLAQMSESVILSANQDSRKAHLPQPREIYDQTIPLPQPTTGLTRFCDRYAPRYCGKCQEVCHYKSMVSR